MSADDLTWTKAKNVLLTGAAALACLMIGQILSDVGKTRADVADIKVALATYQANASALEQRVARMERLLEKRPNEEAR